MSCCIPAVIAAIAIPGRLLLGSGVEIGHDLLCDVRGERGLDYPVLAQATQLVRKLNVNVIKLPRFVDLVCLVHLVAVSVEENQPSLCRHRVDCRPPVLGINFAHHEIRIGKNRDVTRTLLLVLEAILQFELCRSGTPITFSTDPLEERPRRWLCTNRR